MTGREKATRKGDNLIVAKDVRRVRAALACRSASPVFLGRARRLPRPSRALASSAQALQRRVANSAASAMPMLPRRPSINQATALSSLNRLPNAPKSSLNNLFHELRMRNFVIHFVAHFVEFRPVSTKWSDKVAESDVFGTGSK